MRKSNQDGSVATLVALGVFIVLFITAASFGAWAFMSRQDYKNNADKKAADAVTIAIKQEDSKKDAEFVEQEKNPLKSYVGPETYGKITIQYPKTWSAMVDETASSDAVLNGYFHPDFVPGIDTSTNFALRLQVVSQSYDQILKQFDNLVKAGKTRVAPYQAPKVSGVTGARVDGMFDSQKSGSMILLPLRDKTIKLWTEGDQYVGDFNNNILPNLTFVP